MKRPPVVRPGEEVTTVGKVFGTPIVVKGWTWLPIIEAAAWGFTSWLAGVRRPERSITERLRVGLLMMPVLVGSEWCHNFTHAAAARLVGKPMDAIRITWGTPLLVYFNIDDESVAPREHIVRSLGGPIFNALTIPLAILLRGMTNPDSAARDLANIALGTNTFILGVALLPIPGLDGGPILKWSLVSQGVSRQDADRVVRRTNGVLGLVLAGASVVAAKKRHYLVAGVLAQLAATSMGIASGLLQEQ
ncbi:MAG: hypothetical protein GTO18_09170 [Anaerolineales bacterium]|nr:hypothetical protein [Anaerolineales bacterium]